MINHKELIKDPAFLFLIDKLIELKKEDYNGLSINAIRADQKFIQSVLNYMPKLYLFDFRHIAFYIKKHDRYDFSARVIDDLFKYINPPKPSDLKPFALKVYSLNFFTQLFIGNNNLSEIEIPYLPNLQRLNLNNNGLKDVKISSLPNLQGLSLYNNSLSESCKKRILAEKLEKYPNANISF